MLGLIKHVGIRVAFYQVKRKGGKSCQLWCDLIAAMKGDIGNPIDNRDFTENLVLFTPVTHRSTSKVPSRAQVHIKGTLQSTKC
eukprot:scaffold92529_cov14-Tisochrysis_lutea.AAC.1